MAIYTGRMSLPAPPREGRARNRVPSAEMRGPIVRLTFAATRPVAAAAAAVRGRPGLFSEQNARAHVDMLAGTIGSRPIGTPANAQRARTTSSTSCGCSASRCACRSGCAAAELGRTARVSNIIAIQPGRRSRSDRRSSRTTTRCQLGLARPTMRLAWRCRSRRPACWRREPIATGR